MSLTGISAALRVECAKLAAQVAPRVLVAGSMAGPVVFAGAIRMQSSLPTDTLFGRAAKESGFALSLTVLGFAALWVLPVVASVAGGDLFSSEDRSGTWKTVLTRSRSRSEIFAGKAVAALAFSALAVAVLAASSILAGVLLIGPNPLIDLSGVALPSSVALTRVLLAWMSVLPPTFGFTAIAVLISTATRSSTAGVGVFVLMALTMQLAAFVDGPDGLRQLLLTSAFGAWHGLLTAPTFSTPLVRGSLVSALHVLVCLGGAYALLRRRDIGG